MSTKINAYAALSPRAPLQPFAYEPGPLGPEQVEIKVETCGICHSDLSMLDNEWGMTKYPIIPGHEVTGTVVATGPQAKRVKVGDRVGLGWNSGSCLACPACLAGDHNLCVDVEGTIVGRPGGFAERVRCHWVWATPIPAGVDPISAGPLLCGGITVFNPIVEFRVRSTDRVGVVGIGGLGHLALQFLNKWGCEVTAFTSSDSKRDEARRLGAHHAVNSKDAAALKQIAGTLDFLLVTVNAPLDWKALLATLAPKGRMHFVGAVLEPIPIAAFGLISGQKSVSGSPTGSPATVDKMLAFCARHQIAPQVERFPMSRVNDALTHLREGKARYRVVLEADFR
ncbi:NAD(P)-dependent alcohol dehydrogenase [Opitutus sp. ER46]|uniref:NADPH-dependent aldehyde reductase Ahr n=1 Tax=Opitutus sp. ER46 TaxID=2161864 RepID=UPI000D2F9CCD|nr:NAD(P)-dependent alcohol dehydrogenase [Opitutus sp. ER46]PTX98593.1 alcohol dehydrogenase [Opitutus sp. ER46]